jgi:hypothetical protein
MRTGNDAASDADRARIAKLTMLAAFEWFEAMYISMTVFSAWDLRLVLFLRLHKVDELNCLPMSASGERWNYATACIPLD